VIAAVVRRASLRTKKAHAGAAESAALANLQMLLAGRDERRKRQHPFATRKYFVLNAVNGDVGNRRADSPKGLCKD
jgi:hypothetical protein